MACSKECYIEYMKRIEKSRNMNSNNIDVPKSDLSDCSTPKIKGKKGTKNSQKKDYNIDE